MRRSNLTPFIASLAFGLLCAPSLRAQARQSQSAPHKLAIEVSGRDHLEPFPVSETSAEGGFLQTSPRRRLPGWKQPAGVAPLIGVKIRSTYEGEGVRLKIAFVFDDSEPADAPGPKYGEREQAVSSHFVREGEAITVAELRRFGYEPMTLRVVPALPSRLAEPPPAAQPQIANPLQSVTVVSFESEEAAPKFYRLTLRNLSAKSITALEITAGGGGRRQRMEATSGRPLMAPGGTCETSIDVSGGWLKTPQGYVADARQQTWTVGTVVFDDGTYEGEARTAAVIAASRLGRRTQLARVLALLETVSETAGRDAVATLEELKARVSALRIDADASKADALLASFPELAKEQGRAWIMSQILDGLRRGRHEALSQVEELAARAKRDGPTFDLRQSLQAVKELLGRRGGIR